MFFFNMRQINIKFFIEKVFRLHSDDALICERRMKNANLINTR